MDDSIVITYTGNSDGIIPGYATQHTAAANEIIIQIKDAKGHLSDIVNKCSGAQIAIHNIDIKSSGLEAIFLHLTGRQLRD